MMLPIGFEPMISTLLVWRLTNLAIEAFHAEVSRGRLPELLKMNS